MAHRGTVIRRRTSEAEDKEKKKRPRLSQATKDQSCTPQIQSQTSGTIIQLQAINFMCHSNLLFRFNGSVNFITGQNGSGKSAVLTALMVCLGVRANATDRGNNLAGLVRTGERRASIKVTLSNTGENSFQPEAYGKEITIEREIRSDSAKATSTYRLYGANGKQVSTKKADLVAILDALDIQVDNPVAILTQEMSKNFLRSDDPKDKYELFMRATRLRKIQEGYATARNNYRLAEAKLELKSNGLKALSRHVSDLEKELNAFKNRATIKDKIEALEKQLAWARVEEAEQAEQEAERELESSSSKLSKLNDMRDRFEAGIDKINSAEASMQERKAAVMVELEQLNMRKQELQNRVRQTRIKREEAVAKLKLEQERANRYRKERDSLVAEIARQRNEGLAPEQAAEEERARQEEKQVQTNLEQLRATEPTRAKHLQHCEETVKRREAELSEVRAEDQHLRSRTADVQQRIEETRRCSGDPRALLGKWVSLVDRDIEQYFQQKRFKKRPIGPVGAYIRIRAGCEEWTPLVEKSLDGVLRAYLVEDRHDMHVMNEILERHCSREQRKPHVITSKFLTRVHDVSKHGIDTTSSDFVSVWSVLDVQHPVVANAIIDQTRAESILLLSTDQEARELLAYAARVPTGCAQAYTKSGYQYYPDPNYKTYPAPVSKKPRYLQVSVEEAIQQMQSELQQYRLDQRASTDRVSRAQTVLLQARGQEADAKKLVAETRKAVECADRRLRDLQTRERPEPVNLDALQEEVDSFEGILAETEQKITAANADVEVAKNTHCQAEEERRAFSEQLKDRLAAPVEAIETELVAIQKKRTDVQRELSRVISKLKLGTADQCQLQQTLDLKSAKRQQFEETANAVCQRDDVSTNRKSSAYIERRIKQVQASLEEHNRRSDLSLDEVRANFQEAQLRFQKADENLQLLQQEVNMLKIMLDKRDEKYAVLRHSLASRVTQFFHVNLEGRQLKGSIKFDHTTGKLDMTVRPDRVGAGAGSTQQLSGGERSFTTLAYVLAMWSAMYSPFRMLDEFDVFMDEVNRKIGHDMLLREALSRDTQFVFISPLAIDTKDDPRITVHRMQPPVRQ